MRASLQIFAAWFLGAAIAGGGLIVLLRPMAGLFFLIATATVVSMTIAPIAHIRMRRSGHPLGETVSTLILALFIVFAIMAFTGTFNFS